MELRADHGTLPVIGAEAFRLPLEPHHLVTFLNRSLKRRDIIFGLEREGEGFRLTIYDVSDQAIQTARNAAGDNSTEQNGM